MEESVKIFVENLISLCGASGNVVPVLRHVFLVIVAVALAWSSDLIGRKILVPLIEKIQSRTHTKWDSALLNRKFLVSICHIFPAVIIWELLPMIFYQFPAVKEFLSRATAIYIVVMFVRTAIVFLDGFNDLETKQRSSVQQYFRTMRGVARVLFVFVASIIVIAVAIGKNPTTLFAGLGATSAILMLVFKDAILGFVAGLRLTSNDMVHKGDWITVPQAGADGEVLEISLTTVKIQNFDNTIVTVTPQMLVDGSFQNWIGMEQSPGRRVKRKILFDFRSVVMASDELKKSLLDKNYLTKEELKGDCVNMSLFRTYVEKYLKNNDNVNAEMTYMFRQLEAGDTGLPMELYFFLKNKEWVTYEHQLAEVLEHIYAVVPDFNLVIYQRFPMQ